MSTLSNSWIPLSGLNRRRLESNLAVLRENQPDLVSRIDNEKNRADILIRPIEKGFCQCKRIHAQGETWIHGEQAIDRNTAHIYVQIQQSFDQGAWLVFVHDVGLEYTVHEIAIQLEIQRRGEPKGIICIERDPGLVCAAFSLFDFTQPMRTGRILWAIGNDLESQIETLCAAHHLETLDPQQIRVIPEIRGNSEPRGEWDKGVQQVIGKFWEIHKNLRKNYFRLLREAEQYWSKPKNPIRKVWSHFNTDRGGAEMVLGLLAGFQEAGLEIRAPMITDRFFTRFYRVAADFFAFQPDLIVCQNHSSNYMASFAQPVPIPRVVWYVDDPMNMANIPFHPHDRIFSLSAEFAPEIARRGRPLAGILHPAAASQLTPPLAPPEWKHSVSYVGSVKDNRRLMDRLPLDIRERLEDAIGAMRKDPLQSAVQQNELGAWAPDQIAFLAKILPDAIPKARYMTSVSMVHYFVYMEANTRRRIEALSFLEDVEGLGIYGPVDWTNLLPSSRLQQAYRGTIGSRTDLSNLYRCSRVNLCINSLQGFGFLNNRVLDVPSVGGFVLAEWVPLLPTFFQSEECAWFRTWEEMKESVLQYNSAEEERFAIIRRAQQRIRAEHTYRQRAVTILNQLTSAVATVSG